MFTSEDYERFYLRYTAEALPHGESIQAFCLKNNVPYNLFQKWFKDTRHKVVPIQDDKGYLPQTIDVEPCLL